MLKYNDNNIKEWFVNDASIIKVYHNDAICYYKITSSGGTSGQTPCFAVVDDITQYTDTEFEDVFNLANEKWYKLNNLNQYEEYGVYGSGRTITTYEGKLTIDDGYEYQYSGNSWVNVGEVSGSTASLPNVDFMLNYNARDYDSSTYSISKTEGQLKDVDAVCNYGYHIVDHSSDGYVSVTGNSRMLLSGTTYMGRNNTQSGCTMTVVSKARTTNGYSVFTNRGGTNPSQMNWMWRYPTDAIFLHGSSSYNNPNYFTNTTGTPIVASIRTYYDNGVKQQLNDWTNSGSYSGNFQYGTEYNGTSALFCDYVTVNSEFWQGDFYWVYMTQSVLTDEQIQQVIDYNEGNGTVVYPINYDEIQDPPSSVTFSSMTEAESYECPYVGLNADIDGTDYIFDANYDWVTKYGLFEITGEYLCADGNKYKKMEEKVRNVDDTWSSQTPPVYEIGDLIESASTDCQIEFKTIQELLDSGDYQQSTITSREFTLSPRLSGITYFRLYTQSSGSSGSYCFCDLYSDTNTGTSMFAIKTDYSGTLYTSVGGYGSIKAAADDENCSWAYWVDEYTMEVDVLDAVGTTLYLKQWQDNFQTSFIGFK